MLCEASVIGRWDGGTRDSTTIARASSHAEARQILCNQGPIKRIIRPRPKVPRSDLDVFRFECRLDVQDQRGGATTRGLIPKTRRPLERSFATSMAVLIPSIAPKQTKCSIANCDDGKSCVRMARWLFEQGFLSASRTFDGTIIFCRLAPIDLINKFNIACFSRTTVVRYQIFGRIKRPQHSASS